MEESSKTMRLSKAARELNVGIATIVEYLHKKGINIDSNPNTKLTDDMLTILTREFQGDKKVKEEAQKIGLESAPKQTISIDDKMNVRKEQESEFEQELYIKGTTVSYGGEYKQVKVEKPKKEGKTVAPAPVEEKPAAEAESSMIPEEAATILPVAAMATTEVEPAGPKEEVSVAQEAPPAEKSLADSGIKVVGKIDLDSIEKKSKPKKDKEEKKKKKDVEAAEKEPSLEEKTAEPVQTEPPEAPAEVVKETEIQDIPEELIQQAEEAIAAVLPDPNFIPREKIKLEGPKILGKIDLPVDKKTLDKKKEPVASSSDDKLKGKKKKRKRIKKSGHDAVVTETTDEEKQKAKPKERKLRKEFPKTEVSDEDIQRQIKETLARLSGTGKSKASKYRRLKRDLVSQQIQEEHLKQEEEKKVIKATEFVTANDLAVMMGASVTSVISTCMSLGLMVSINQRLDAETIVLVADEFGYKVEFVGVEVQEAIMDHEILDKPEELQHRPPIVTVMGHVDHGKTLLLDYIRKTNVVAGEAGGITQHIGAYEVTHEDGRKVTFLDTPGHEAFTAMRARGAKITDVAIIIIAADDAVMPQTVEAINHAQAAAVPMVFAINKIDKANANSDRIREQLSAMNILVEEWGGKYQCQEISAKTGLNIDLLVEKVLLEAEILDLKANPDRLANGTIIESALDKGRGYVAKVLVQNGTLKVGDIVIAGSVFGRVKAMYNERNSLLKSAGPSQPVLLLGFTGAPQAGDTFNVMSDEREAKNLAYKRQQLQREQGIRTQKHITLDEIGRRIAIGDFKELNVIVKGDVDGSVEALSDSLLKLGNEQVQVNVIHKSVGPVTESDVLLASASNAIIIAFQVRPSVSARKLAEKEQIDIRLYSIIYTAINEIKSAIEGMLAPEIEEKITCNVEVKDIFKINKVGTIAGCLVLDGKIYRNTRIRVIRDGIVVYSGNLASLKRFKDDVKEVVVGQDCGLNIENFNDIKVGDIIEGYEEIEVKRKL